MNGALFEPNPVFVCRRCGRGFVTYPGPRDPYPMWSWLGAGLQGEDCFGEVLKRNRKDLIDGNP